MGEARVLTQVGFLTPPPPPSSPSRRTALRESPQELLCFPNLQGWGGCRRLPVWAQREGAERGKEEGAASSHKRLQRARASAKRASTAQRSPKRPAGAWAPSPAPALWPRPFILGPPSQECWAAG